MGKASGPFRFDLADPQSMPMKKFILVDPSFDGVTGDKWQYAVAFARSAHANGFQFILLSARQSPQLPPIDGRRVDQRAIFSYAFYEHEQIVMRHSLTDVALAARRQRLRDRREREDLDQLRSRADSEGDIGRRELFRRRIAAAERRASRRASELEGMLAKDPGLAQPFNRDDFGIALSSELARISPTRGDVLFFHTMTPAMLESFSEASLYLPGDSTYDVDAYCLFHFGSEAPDARTFLDRYHSYSHDASLISRLAVGSPFRRLHLLATSQILAQECSARLGVPFGVFHGLANLSDHFRACGGEAAARAAVVSKVQALSSTGAIRIAARAGDIDGATARAIGVALRMLARYGFTVDFRLLFHAKSLPLVRDILEALSPSPATLVDVSDNDAYVSELTRANLMLLTYAPARYAKRVSAVLHDCSVMGTSCVVPASTTMATAAHYADIWVYDGVCALAQTILQAVRSLRYTPQSERDAKIRNARAIYCQDVVSSILSATQKPSLEVAGRGPFAAVFMPAWGRCGSSYAMEGHIRFLLSRGYFVIQVLAMDKPVEPREAIPYFWQMLRENSTTTRGSVQRIAFTTKGDITALEQSAEYASSSAFEQYIARIGISQLHDDAVASALQQAELAIVNHVFQGELARRLVRGKIVLETHDIQSYQMHAWPLPNAASGQLEPLARFLEGELTEVTRYDHVVNVSPNEHRILSTANPRASLVTPYIVLQSEGLVSMPDRVSDLVDEWGLSEHYRGIDKFDILLLGDSHAANRESAEWFIEKVYLPHLQPRGASLALAGRLSDLLYAKYGTIQYVFYMGFVPSVQVVRALSRVSVLPDVRGTGISIKTLETFASGQAFVATRCAIRGFGHLLPAGFPTVDDPAGFAFRVAELLDNPELAAASRQRAHGAYDLLTSPHKFNKAWEAILDDILVPTSSMADKRASAA